MNLKLWNAELTLMFLTLQKDILVKIGSEVNGVNFSSYTFQAVVYKYKIKDKANLSSGIRHWRVNSLFE